MRTMNRYTLLIVMMVLSLASFAQLGHYVNSDVAYENPDAVQYLKIDGDSVSLMRFSEKAPLFEHLMGIAIIGEVKQEQTLFAGLSYLKMLQQIIFKDNKLKQIQLGASSSTIEELWIEGSPDLSAESLNILFKQAQFIKRLKIRGSNDPMPPLYLANLYLLRRADINETAWPDALLLAALPSKNLQHLNLGDNDFQVPSKKGWKRFQALEYLDLSGNQLEEIPKEIKELKALETLILNRNGMSQMNKAVKVLQKTTIETLYLPSDSTLKKDKIQYQLPGFEIEWTNDISYEDVYSFVSHDEFPDTTKAIEVQVMDKQKEVYQHIEGSVEGEVLSAAYLEYERLPIVDPLEHFDTTGFEGRYKDSSYSYTTKIRNQNHTEEGYFYKLKYDDVHGVWIKAKKKKKINHAKMSPLRIDIVPSPKSLSESLLFTITENVERPVRNELKPFSKIVWESMDAISAESFAAEVINQKVWNDVRFTYDEDQMEFTITLKGRFESIELTAGARKSTDLTNVVAMVKANVKNQASYDKALVKADKKFVKSLEKEKKKLIKPHRKSNNAYWAKVEKLMTADEKALPRMLWLDYYQTLKKNEYPLLANASFDPSLFSRFLESQAYKMVDGNDFYVGLKRVSFSLSDTDSVVTPVKGFCLIDLDRKLSKYYVGDTISTVALEAFHSYVIYGETINGDVFFLDNDQIHGIRKSPQTQIIIDPKLLDRKASMMQFYQEYVLPEANQMRFSF